MLNALEPLLQSDLVNESTRTAIQEAWDAKLVETRDVVRAELREEFAQRYEHDKTVMVEALDRMVTESLATEIQEFRAEKAQLAEDRVKFRTSMSESSKKFNNFMVNKLAEEITELRKDRKMTTEGVTKLENFVMKALSRELAEFAKDKRAVVETKVRLVREASKKLNELRSRFVRESAAKMSKTVSQHLNSELTALHEDIKIARENNFGRRIFETFASEFSATHLNENAEIRKLRSVVAKKDTQLREAAKIVSKKNMLIETKDKEARINKAIITRKQVMENLLSSLNRNKQVIMRDLLEGVQTEKLQASFDKYLPSVLTETKAPVAKQAIVESRKAVTGDKSAKPQAKEDDASTDNVIELRRLAGL
jgi:hypothetical protein